MKKISYESKEFRNKEATEYLAQLKTEGKRIIDVGASLSDWTYNYIDAIVDINKFETDKIFFQGNITLTDVWDDVESYVEKNGKFDFSICSHTLEDISNPLMVCKKLEKISDAGLIMIPSKFIELGRHEGQYRGWIHHRWVWNIEGEKLVGYPKVNFIEYDYSLDSIPRQLNDDNIQIVLFWQKTIPIEIINGDFLGPSTNHVIGYYQNLIYKN